jgi:hypothetical protein
MVKDDQIDVRRMGRLINACRSADGLDDYMQRLLVRYETMQRRASETASNVNIELSNVCVYAFHCTSDVST